MFNAKFFTEPKNEVYRKEQWNTNEKDRPVIVQVGLIKILKFNFQIPNLKFEIYFFYKILIYICIFFFFIICFNNNYFINV